MVDPSFIRVLFVCTGNICRSPTAEAVFNAQATARGLDTMLSSDSAGTTDYHQGESADQRSIEAARKRGYDMSHHRARQVCINDFTHFNYIVALDRIHLKYIKEHQAHLKVTSPRIVTLMDYAPEARRLTPQNTDVPDPYYGGSAGFDLVLDLVEAGCMGLIEHIMSETNRKSRERNQKTAPKGP